MYVRHFVVQTDWKREEKRVDKAHRAREMGSRSLGLLSPHHSSPAKNSKDSENLNVQN